MAERSGRALIIGGGAFGLAAALEMQARGWHVQLVDRGSVPHPEASSTDISKMIRADYGADVFYSTLMERAFEGWRAWNESWDQPLFHESGLVVFSSHAMRPGCFEYDSYRTLVERGYPLERLDEQGLRARLPNWCFAEGSEGYINPVGGWAESGKVVARLFEQAKAQGVNLRSHTTVSEIVERGGRVCGARCGDEFFEADAVVVAAGAWTPGLLPELAPMVRVIGQGIFHFAPEEQKAWASPHFLPWAGDIATQGWYGFSAHPDGVVKIANHGPGVPLDPLGPRFVPDVLEQQVRAFVRRRLPGLSNAPIVGKRMCLYCDTADGDFIIDAHPERPGLFVATGGSGHGFKFLPVLGELVADVVAGGAPKERFAWRLSPRIQGVSEPARYVGAHEDASY